jgi:hypothetical protein
MMVLFDLQESLKETEIFKKIITPYGENPSAINIIEVAATKTVHVAGRTDFKPGLAVNTPELHGLQSGDRITVTGRLGSGVPKSDWAMVIDRRKIKSGVSGGWTGLAQHVSPEHNELFTITHLLDAEDLDKTFMIRSNHWGNVTESMDFYLDSILITRNVSQTSFVKDEREQIYSLASDGNLKKLRPGDITRFLRAAGTPKFTIIEKNSRKGVHLANRINNWDGLDIWLPSLELKQGNSYSITVNGRVDGVAGERARLMLQIIPGYIWRSEKYVYDDDEFTLNHTFSATELQTAQTIRIASDDEGAKMSFFIYDIEVTINTEGA